MFQIYLMRNYGNISIAWNFQLKHCAENCLKNTSLLDLHHFWDKNLSRNLCGTKSWQDSSQNKNFSGNFPGMKSQWEQLYCYLRLNIKCSTWDRKMNLCSKWDGRILCSLKHTKSEFCSAFDGFFVLLPITFSEVIENLWQQWHTWLKQHHHGTFVTLGFIEEYPLVISEGTCH